MVDELNDLAEEQVSLEGDSLVLEHVKGVLSMDPISSHFSFCGTSVPWLDGHHIVFGQVNENLVGRRKKRLTNL